MPYVGNYGLVIIKPVGTTGTRTNSAQLVNHAQCFDISCHGDWGDGSDKGPPLMHKLYVPSHHGDETFYRAAIKGARAITVLDMA
jgi:hypothetical protein